HLDSETEVLVQQALAEALTGRSSLVIAHRLSTIQAADEIVVIDDGRIVERGPHHELVERGGLYAELYETQYAKSPDEIRTIATAPRTTSARSGHGPASPPR